jgi:uncharacterized protein (DUF1499 family)
MLARWVLVIGSLSMASLILGPLLSGIRLLSPLVGFGLTSAGGALGIFGLLVGGVAVMRGGLAAVLPGLVICGMVSAFSIGFLVWARRYPPINDITTDTASPPEFIGALSLTPNHGRDMSYPGESFARRQKAAYPDLAPLRLPLPPAKAFRLVETMAQAMPHWKITRVEEESMSLEGVAETPLFRFLDDFVIQVRPSGQGSLVEMRSRSREGKGDLGVNAQRIRDFFAALEQQAAPR